MVKKRLKRWGAALLACAMLCGDLPSNVDSVQKVLAAETEAFSVQFDSEYAAVGEALSVTVQGGTDVTYEWYIDGKKIENATNSYTPTVDDLEAWIKVKVTDGANAAEAELYCSKLPVVYIDTENKAQIVSKEDYINATMKIQGNDTYNSENSTLYDGVIEIRGRGNSTWSMPKKPYKIKLDKKTDVFGMGKNKHWVLLANYSDESLMRNTLAYNFSGSLGMEQMSTVWVDVVLNGEYVGNYQFCEQVRVDETRVDVFDWESFAEDSAAVIAEAEGFDKDTTGDLEEYMLETDMSWITSGVVTFGGNTYDISDYPDIEVPSINGGYILELDEYYDEVSKFKTDSNQPIMFKNPEFVATNKDMMTFVQTYVQAFEDAVQSSDYMAEYEGEDTHYSELYDFDSLVDYWLISEIFFNEEFNKKSTYMYKEIDELMKMGPIWDMDYSSGGEGETYHTDQWATTYYSLNAQANQWYKYLIQDPYFITKVQERYWEIRNDQVKTMIDSIDAHYALLVESAEADTEVWPTGQSSFRRNTFTTEVTNLKNWFNSHLAWMDEQMATEDSLAASLAYKSDSGMQLTLSDSDGNALESDTVAEAPADGLVDDDEGVKLTITGSQYVSGTAEIYVNSQKLDNAVTVGTTAVGVDIPASALTASAGEKDVIEVKVLGTKGVIAANYVTVKETAACTHVNTEVVGRVEATCSKEGFTGNTVCSDCGETVAVGTTIQTVDHTWDSNYTIDKEATCTEAGSKSKHCTTEGCTAKTDVTAIEKLAHTYGVWTITKEATCIEEGSKERSCTCGDKQTEVIAKTEHTWDSNYTIDKEATCTEAGSKSKHCTTEGCTAKTDVTAIEKLAHTYGAWTTTKEATCIEEGSKERSCTCGAKQTEVIAKTEHTWDSDYTIDKEATCTEAGSKSKHCTTEGCTAKTDVTAIAKKTHTYGEWVVVKEPTVTSEGLKEKTCTGCGDKQTESIEKLPQIEVPEEVDKAAAQEYYDKCLVYYKADDYTEESWAVYAEAMDALKAALANEEITVEELQAAVDAVSAATEALEAAEDEPVVPEQPDDEDKEDSEDGDKEESVQTGDMTPIMLWGILMIAALLVIIKRRKIA